MHSRGRWFPNPTVKKIKISDLPSAMFTWAGPGESCFSCKGNGRITRKSHPYSLGHVDGQDSHACGLCDGTGWYVPHSSPIVIGRPRSKLVLFGRWRDPATGIVHSRSWTNSKHRSEVHPTMMIRPSCGNLGMRAIPRTEWNFEDRITCAECLVFVERALFRHAGVPLPSARTESDDATFDLQIAAAS